MKTQNSGERKKDVFLTEEIPDVHELKVYKI